jgi:hypothetical protein
MAVAGRVGKKSRAGAKIFHMVERAAKMPAQK